MAVKLDIITNVKGQNGVNQLQSGLDKLGRNAQIASTRLKQLQGAAAKSRATFAALGTTLKVGVAASLAAVSFGIGKFIRDTFSAGQLTESLQVRFKLLFNSATEGAKAFKVLNTFAGKVPFSLEAIAAGSGNLAVIAKDANELAKILEITGNVAAATGLDFRQTAEQIQRAFAGGIAAADVFRERGVRAMLGFEAGAKVSIEDTRKRFFEVFGSGGQFSTATKEFEKTLEAQVSFVQDAYFRFRQAAAQPLFEGVKQQLVALVGNFKRNDTQLKELAKTVGTNLAQAFKNIEGAIRFVSRNIDLLVTGFKVFIGLKVATVVAGIAAQFILMAQAIKTAGISLAALNVALRANIVGIVITTIQVGVVAFIAFNDAIMKVVNTIKDFFIQKMKEAQLAVLNFVSKLKIFPKTSAEAEEAAKKLSAELNTIKMEANEVIASYTTLNKKQKELFSGTRTTPRAERDPRSRPNFGAASDPDFLKKQSDIAALNERIFTMNRDFIRDQAKINANQTTYKDLLHASGIEAKLISDTISTGFLDGLRQGNSLLEISKNLFKSVAQTIAETIIKKTIELQIEKLFEFLGTKKLTIEKQITAEKAQQLAFATATAAVSGGSSSSLLSFFKFNKGGVVPGGAPYNDRIPALLTPGETVIPRGESAGSIINNNTINVSGNVDQRAIDQIRAVITSSPSHVGGANKTYTRNTAGLSMRRK
tara:strand:+ start:2195 stop:4318 length:2124 start_codon:yes stop_codon:yes gene_type:complete